MKSVESFDGEFRLHVFLTRLVLESVSSFVGCSFSYMPRAEVYLLLEYVWLFVGLGVYPTRPVLKSVSLFGT